MTKPEQWHTIEDNPIKFLRHYYYYNCLSSMKYKKRYETEDSYCGRLIKASEKIWLLSEALKFYKESRRVKDQYDTIRKIFKRWKNWIF